MLPTYHVSYLKHFCLLNSRRTGATLQTCSTRRFQPVKTLKMKEKIRKFINEYSHNDLIEINEDFVENLIGESTAVISDIFDWIKELDAQHYREMVDATS